MRQGEPIWDGDAWQAYCDELLALHHPDAYQVIPAGDRGDCGLEGHSTDGKGCGYQCYAADQDINIAQRRTRQINKITDTVSTLIKQRERLGRVLGEHQIKKLIFLFPRYDSADVNAHLRKQEERLRKAAAEHSIGAISTEVVLAAWTDTTQLAAERSELDRVGSANHALPEVEVEVADIERFRLEAADSLPEALAKLKRRFGGQKAHALLDTALEDKLIGDEQERLLAERPRVYESYQRLKGHERREMTRRSTEDATGDLTQKQIIDELSSQISARVPGLDPRDHSTLSAGAVASWLIECPLDFPEPESGPGA